MSATRNPQIYLEDIGEALQELTMTERGELFTAMIEYYTENKIPTFDNTVLRILFRQWEKHESYNVKKYLAETLKRGYAGHCPKKETNTPKPDFVEYVKLYQFQYLDQLEDIARYLPSEHRISVEQWLANKAYAERNSRSKEIARNQMISSENNEDVDEGEDDDSDVVLVHHTVVDVEGVRGNQPIPPRITPFNYNELLDIAKEWANGNISRTRMIATRWNTFVDALEDQKYLNKQDVFNWLDRMVKG